MNSAEIRERFLRFFEARGHTVVPSASLVADDPALVNSDPEGEGWFFKLKLDNPAELEGLMDEAAYREWVKTL